MDKRFLYLILVIVIILVVVLAYQDSSKGSQTPADKLNVTPTISLQTTTPMVNQNPTTTPNQQQQTPTSSESAIVELEGGVRIQELREGTGRAVNAEDTIAVNYVGYFEDGKKFDSSYDANKPLLIQIGVGQVIKGWDIGLMGMKEGGQRRLFIPAALAYGEQGAGSIPPNTNLLFDVELLSVK